MAHVTPLSLVSELVQLKLLIARNWIWLLHQPLIISCLYVTLPRIMNQVELFPKKYQSLRRSIFFRSKFVGDYESGKILSRIPPHQGQNTRKPIFQKLFRFLEGTQSQFRMDFIWFVIPGEIHCKKRRYNFDIMKKKNCLSKIWNMIILNILDYLAGPFGGPTKAPF